MPRNLLNGECGRYINLLKVFGPGCFTCYHATFWVPKLSFLAAMAVILCQLILGCHEFHHECIRLYLYPTPFSSRDVAAM